MRHVWLNLEKKENSIEVFLRTLYMLRVAAVTSDRFIREWQENERIAMWRLLGITEYTIDQVVNATKEFLVKVCNKRIQTTLGNVNRGMSDHEYLRNVPN